MLVLVEYRQVAFSLVLKERVVCVVPDVRPPEGELFERVGGEVSGPDKVVALADEV